MPRDLFKETDALLERALQVREEYPQMITSAQMFQLELLALVAVAIERLRLSLKGAL